MGAAVKAQIASQLEKWQRTEADAALAQRALELQKREHADLIRDLERTGSQLRQRQETEALEVRRRLEQEAAAVLQRLEKHSADAIRVVESETELIPFVGRHLAPWAVDGYVEPTSIEIVVKTRKYYLEMIKPPISMAHQNPFQVPTTATRISVVSDTKVALPVIWMCS